MSVQDRLAGPDVSSLVPLPTQQLRCSLTVAEVFMNAGNLPLGGVELAGSQTRTKSKEMSSTKTKRTKSREKSSSEDEDERTKSKEKSSAKTKSKEKSSFFSALVSRRTQRINR